MSPPAVHTLGQVERLLSQKTSVLRVCWQGCDAFAKRRSRLRSHERIVLLAAPLLRRWLLPGQPFEPVRHAPSPAFEAQRLTALKSSGFPVPDVLASNADVLVMSALGESLETLLDREADREHRLAWQREAAADLAAFHAAGQWHGGAQVRNLVRGPDGRWWRIDFEAPLDRYLPLPVLQAFDLLLLLTSLARMGDRDALDEIAAAYVATAPSATLTVLRRGWPWLARVANARFVKRVAPAEAARLAALAVLQPLL